MRIVAVVALHHSLVHAMMKGAIELLLGFQMAAIAKLWRLFLHQELAFPGVVRGVAVDTANIVLQVRGSRKIGVFFAIAVAVQATLAGCLRRNTFEGEYLCLVAAAFNVFLARPVASFAALPLRSALVVQRGYEMGSGLKILENVFMAGFAGFGAHVKRWVGEPLIVLAR